ncbi:hypothetical protein OI72_06340 [Aeromonas hydrophila]|nr:hypothetical protein OI72_06340 [Aeromonas hydrophila]
MSVRERRWPNINRHIKNSPADNLYQFTLWSITLVMQTAQRAPDRTTQIVLHQRVMATVLFKLILTKTLTKLTTMI